MQAGVRIAGKMGFSVERTLTCPRGLGGGGGLLCVAPTGQHHVGKEWFALQLIWEPLQTDGLD